MAPTRFAAACLTALLLTAVAFVVETVILLRSLAAAEAGAPAPGVRGGLLLLLLLGALFAAQLTFLAVRRQGRLLETLKGSLEARERSYVEALGTVVTALDARDHEITGHSFRVAAYAVTLARALRVEGTLLKSIEWGALLHDLGKMVVPDAVLRKVGALSSEEWQIMRQHPTWGFEMLAEVRFLQQPAVDIVYSHHERWDGAGYPRGLAGEAIPLAARIFAVVDAYDAITSDRPYRRARGHTAAVAELQRVAGAQLDPEIVEAFARIPEVELRRLRELYRKVNPGLSLPAELFDSLLESGVRKPLTRNESA